LNVLQYALHPSIFFLGLTRFAGVACGGVLRG